MIEKFDYELPIDTKSVSFKTTSLTDGEVDNLLHYVRDEDTNELLPHVPLSLRSLRGGKVKELKFVAFTLRNTFPNNVVLLADKSVMMVTDMDHVGDDYRLFGNRFTSVTRIFECPDCFGVRGVRESVDIVDVRRDVRAKCFVVPNDRRPQVIGNRVDPYTLEKWLAMPLLQ